MRIDSLCNKFVDNMICQLFENSQILSEARSAENEDFDGKGVRVRPNDFEESTDFHGLGEARCKLGMPGGICAAG